MCFSQTQLVLSYWLWKGAKTQQMTCKSGRSVFPPVLVHFDRCRFLVFWKADTPGCSIRPQAWIKGRNKIKHDCKKSKPSLQSQSNLAAVSIRAPLFNFTLFKSALCVCSCVCVCFNCVCPSTTAIKHFSILNPDSQFKSVRSSPNPPKQTNKI